MEETTLSRRSIVKQFVLGTVSSFLAGATWSQRVLAAVTPLETVGTLVVKLSQFTALQSAGGSVRLNVGVSFPVAINRGDSNDFYAVSTDCQHQHCTVNAYSSFLGAMQCSCHGSEYGIDGSLIAGPAETGLQAHPITFDGSNTLKIKIPGMTFAARQITVQSINGGTRRLKLTFDSSVFTDYQVQYQQSLTDAPVVKPFSTTPGGAATQTTFRRTTAPFTLVSTDLYVDATGTSGFFNIALVATAF